MASKGREFVMLSPGRYMKFGLAPLLGVLCLLAFTASPVLAARSYNSQVGEGFNSPSGVSLEANNDIWVSDGGHQVPNQTDKSSNGIYKIDAFPSQTLLATPDTFVPYEYYSLALSVAVDQPREEVFVGQSNGRTVDIFAPASPTNLCAAGEPVCYTHSWTGINGVTNCCGGDVNLAIDNSSGYSEGRIYLSISSPEDNVEAFDFGEHPVDFPATASYIKGNTLLGTPAGPFGQVEQAAVDGNGNLYVADVGKEVVDEFDSTGTFVRSFPHSGGVAVDPTDENVLIAGGEHVSEYDSSGNFLGTVPESGAARGVPAVNSEGYLYVPIGYGAVAIFNPTQPVAKINYSPVSGPTTTSGTLNANIDPNGGGEVTQCKFEYVEHGVFQSTDTNAVQTLTISGATGGTFSLGLKGETTAATGTGNLSAATGQGDLVSGSKTVSNVSTKTGTFAVGEEISGSGIPAGTTITVIGAGTLELSNAATKAATADELSAGSKEVTNLTTKDGVFRVGETISGTGIAPGTTIKAVGSGTLELSIPATETVTASELGAGTPLSFKAGSGTVQSALEALNSIGPGDVSVTGSAGGPYKIEFVGNLSGNPVPQLTADSSALTPGGATASVSTTTPGGHWPGATEVPCLNEASQEVNTHPIPDGSASTPVHAAISGLTTGTTYEYRVVVVSTNGVKFGEAQTYTPSHVLGLSTDAATQVGYSNAMLNGSFVGNGEDTHYYFEYGPTETYGSKTASAPGTDGGSPAGPGRTTVSAELSGLANYSSYHYRVIASNGGGTSHGADRIFTTTPGLPSGRGPKVTEVHSDRAVLHGEIDPNGAPTKARFEYVDQASFEEHEWAEAKTAPAAPVEVGMGRQYVSLSAFVGELEQGTLYHYRVEGTNSTGSGGAEATFSTFPFIPSLNDPCPNAHVRQQTGASLLLDCRAYELVSSGDTGGYDVESSLVANQTPFGSYPEAQTPSGEPQVLYGVHDGGIPGTGNPTNRGVDPYVATRGENGWSTKYVGIPANNAYAGAPFSSTLLEASPSLETLAFGGPEICSPCFADHSTGTPIHLPNGELVQGMAGSIAQPAAEPAGFIGRHLSADGSHFVFGSKSKFESDGNEGEISIYDRNLSAKPPHTHVVSKTPSGQTMKEEGTEIGELDISTDGSRIVIGHLVSEEGGAKYWHLYMNIGDSAKRSTSPPGTTHGVLFDGMTEDGSKVFFTTRDALSTATNQDTDESADIYQAEVNGAGTLTLTRISTGTEGTGNTDKCEPAANTKHEHWNTTGAEEGLRRRSGRRRRRGCLGERHDLLPQPREARRLLQRGPERPQPLRRPAGLCTAFRRDAGVERQRETAALRTSLHSPLWGIRARRRDRNRTLHR